jgi:hypothetical protein
VLRELTAMFEALTGKAPTPGELREAAATLAQAPTPEGQKHRRSADR